MRARGASVALLLAGVVAGCGGGGAGGGGTIDLTIDAVALSETTLAGVKRLEISLTGAQMGTRTVMLDRALHREERVVVRPATLAGPLTLTVVALDGSGAALARGTSDAVTPSASRAVAAKVTLGGGPLDLGTDGPVDGGSDGPPSVDLVADLSADLTVDAFTPADLTDPTDPTDLAVDAPVTGLDLGLDAASSDQTASPDAADGGGPQDLQPLAVGIAISPTSVYAVPGATVNFTATVTNFGDAGNGILWSVTGAGCGALNQTTFLVPDTAVGPCTVTAKAAADSSKTASATVVITRDPLPVVQVTPERIRLGPGAQRTFAATVKFATDTAVTWTVLEGSGGVIDATTGVYTAPSQVGSYHVVATSRADGTRRGQAEVVVAATPLVVVQPASLTTVQGETVSFTATVNGLPSTNVSWSVTGTGAINQNTGAYSASTAGSASVTATEKTLGVQSAPAIVTVRSSGARTISGNASYNGSKQGPIYVMAFFNNGMSSWGTSIDVPGPYTIRVVDGVQGSLTVFAWLDVGRLGRYNAASDPTGSRAVTLGSVSLSNQNISLSDAVGPNPDPPNTDQFANPMDQGLLVSWSRSTDSMGRDTADHYNVYASFTNPPSAANQVMKRTVSAKAATRCLLTPLVNDRSYFVGVSAVRGGFESAINVASSAFKVGGSGGGVGGYTVDGTVGFSGRPPTGPLLVRLEGPMMAFNYLNLVPDSPQTYQFTNLMANGAWKAAAIVDTFGDGELGPLDLGALGANPFGRTSVLVPSGMNTTAPTITLPATGAVAWVGTNHDLLTGDNYSINLRVESNTRIPVRATMVSSLWPGPPSDLGLDVGNTFSYFDTPKTLWKGSLSLGSTKPNPGDPVTFYIAYDDGTQETVTVNVTAVMPLVGNLQVSGASTGQPTYAWTAPSPAPTRYEIEINVGGTTSYFANFRLAQGTTSFTDPQMTVLPPGSYNVSVRVTDDLDNRSETTQSFTVP